MNQAVIEKLRKMMRQEASAYAIGSIAEAEAFGAKIQEMLIQHSLSMSDVEIQAEEAVNEQPTRTTITPDKFGEQAKGAVQMWQVDLLQGIAQANNCHNLIVTGTNRQVLIGFEADKQVCVALFAYFVNLGKQIVETEFKKYKRSNDYDQYFRRSWGTAQAGISRNWKRSFLLGFAEAIKRRLRQEKARAVTQAETTQTQTAGLVHLRNREAIVQGYLKAQKFGTYRGATGANNGDAYRAGQQAGNSVGLSGKSLGSGGGGQLN